MNFFIQALWTTGQKALSNRLPNLAEEMAFNLILAIFPALLVVATAIGLFGSAQETFQDLVTNLGRILPKDVMDILQIPLRQVAFSENSSLFSLSLLGTLWAASGALSTAMDALDKIHEIEAAKQRPFWLNKLIAIGLFLTTIILIIIACIMIFISGSLLRQFSSSLALGDGVLVLWDWLQWPIALALVTTGFALTYRFGSAQRPTQTPIFPGALLGSFLWLATSFLFNLYIIYFANFNQVYGSIGALIVVLLWLKLSAASLLFGEQYNAVLGAVLAKNLFEKVKSS
jgi:membrane protein